MIFIALNTLFNGFILGIILQIAGSILKAPITVTEWVLIGYVISAMLTLIGYTRLAGNLVCIFVTGRKAVSREISRIEPLLKNVIDSVNKSFNSNYKIEDIKIRITDNKIANVCALGYNIITVSTGSLDAFNDNQLRAVLAREAAHLYYRDSVRTIALILGSLGTQIVIWIFWLAEFIRIALIKMISLLKHGVIFNLLLFLPYIILSPIFAINWVGTKVFYLFNRLLSRKSEYRADAFAAYLGYKSDIIDVLETLNHMLIDDDSLIGRLTAPYPVLMQRIGALEDREVQQKYSDLFRSEARFSTLDVGTRNMREILLLMGYLLFVGIALSGYGYFNFSGFW